MDFSMTACSSKMLQKGTLQNAPGGNIAKYCQALVLCDCASVTLMTQWHKTRPFAVALVKLLALQVVAQLIQAETGDNATCDTSDTCNNQKHLAAKPALAHAHHATGDLTCPCTDVL